MTDTPIIMGGTNVPSTTVNNFSAPCGVLAWTTTDASSRIVIPAAGTIGSLYADTDTDPASGSYVFTVTKGGVAQTLTCTLSTGVKTAHDTTHSFSVAAGDVISIRCAPGGGTPATLAALRLGLLFTSTNTGESIICGGYTGLSTGSTSTDYGNIQGLTPAARTVQTDAAAIMPTGGSITEMWIDADGAAGVGHTYTFTLFKNGSAQTQTCTISGNAQTSNSDAAHSISYAAGDSVSIEIKSTVSSASVHIRWGFKWVPTTDGESVQLYSSPTTVGNTTTAYTHISGFSTTTSATETQKQQLLAAACTVKKLYVAFQNAPNPTTLTTTVRKNASSTGAPTVAITGAGVTTGNDTATSLSASAGDKVDLQQVSNGTITAGYAGFGVVTFITPAVAGANSSHTMMTGMGM